MEVIESKYDYYLDQYTELNGLGAEDYIGKPNLFLNALQYIGEHLYPAPKAGQRSQLTEDDLRSSFKWYADKCTQFELMPTLNNYGVLIRTSGSTLKRWLMEKDRVGSYHAECIKDFYSYCETAMSNATLSEGVPVVAGIFHLKASFGWDDQPKQQQIEVVHKVAALTDISERYQLQDLGKGENE